MAIKNKKKLKEEARTSVIYIRKYLPKIEHQMRKNAVSQMKDMIQNQVENKTTLNGKQVCLKQGYLFVDEMGNIRYRKKRI